jgi:hypothetical protein
MSEFIPDKDVINSNKPRWEQFLRVTLLTAAAMPPTILLHELAHYAGGVIYNFPNQVLHYGSVTHTAKEQGLPEWQIGIAIAAGPVFTVLFTLGCCLYAAKRKHVLGAIILGIAASVRSLIVCIFYFLALARVLIRGEKYRGEQNFDEYNVAQAFKLPLTPLIAVQIILLIWAWWFLITKTPRKNRRLILAGILVGIILGIALWAFIGPLILP